MLHYQRVIGDFCVAGLRVVVLQPYKHFFPIPLRCFRCLFDYAVVVLFSEKTETQNLL